jgi:hypothetical protein
VGCLVHYRLRSITVIGSQRVVAPKTVSHAAGSQPANN